MSIYPDAPGFPSGYNPSTFPGVNYESILAVTPTGNENTDYNNIQQAVASGLAVLVPGNAPFSLSKQIVYGLGQYIHCLPGVVIESTCPGYTFKIVNPATYKDLQSSGLTGWPRILCGGTASGIEFGDILGIKIQSQVEQAVVAAHALNSNWWSEWNRVKLRIHGSTTGLLFERTGAGTNSYDRSFYKVWSADGTDNPIVIGGVAGSCAIAQGGLELYGNISSGQAIKFATASSVIEKCKLHIGMESDAANGPQTINFLDTTTQIINCVGHLSFVNSWKNSNAVPANIQLFTGQVDGDPTLQTSGATGLITNLASLGLPANWSGNIWVRINSSGDIIINFALQVASGTTITTGETLVSGVTSPFIPYANKYGGCYLTGQTSMVPIEISATGGITYQGPTVTPSATAFLYGTFGYPNGY